MTQKSRKTSAEAQIPQAPSEEDFVGLIRYVKEREKSLSRYSDKLRQSLQSVFDVFGSVHYCQICDCTEDDTKHVKYRDEQGYLHDEQTSTINGITVTYPANADYTHPFKPKIALSLDLQDAEPFAKTEIDDLNWETYVLCTKDLKLYIKGMKNCEIDETGVVCWYTVPDAVRDIPTRRELKLLVQSGRLPKFLALVAQESSKAEAEYSEVSVVADKMAKTIETKDLIEHTNAILKREGAEEIGQ